MCKLGILPDLAARAEMAKYYEEYIRVVTEKGETELAKPANKTKFIEAYNNSIQQLNNLNEKRIQTYEELNYVIGEELFH